MNKLLFLLIFITLFSCNNSKTIRFAVCTDVHQDLIHDATDRLEKFVESSKNKNADFIIQLGDFCMPMEKNEGFLNVWNSFEGKKYHVLGNHDMDISPKIVTQDFWGMEKLYYSYDHGNFHFIILDPNYYVDDEQVVSYSNGNYYNHSEGRAFIPEIQLEWLKNDLAKTDKLTIVFSHQSLEHWGGVKNREEIYKIFKEANQDLKKVVACFCGHDHQDRIAELDGIHYFGLNSTSYAWVGSKLEYSGRFSKEVEEKYSNLKYTLPYQKSVFALVEINSKGTIKIEGIQGDFIKPGPDELGAQNHQYSASISNRVLKF